MAYFAVLGMANGVWLARIPAVKHNLQLSDGLLGIALLAAPAGLVVVVPFTSRILHRFGSVRPTMIAGTCAALVPIALGVASSLPALMAALFAFGLAGGMLDVGMNSQAVLVERGVGRPLMTSFHACYSFGGLGGALLGGAFAWAGIGPAVNFTVVAVPLAFTAALASRWLLTDQGRNEVGPQAAEEPAEAALASSLGTEEDLGRQVATVPDRQAAGRGGSPRSRLLHWLCRPRVLHRLCRALLVDWLRRSGRPRARLALLLMALLAVCSLLGEGSAEGWSAVYLRDNLATSAGLAALAYAGFSVAMAFGRLAGDRLALRFGASVLMRCCGLVAAAGLTTALLSSNPAAAIGGFTIFGAGLSCTFPLLLSAAGNVTPDRPAHGISTVAGFGYAGMLGGPVLIGGLASALGLRHALTVPVVLALLIAFGAGVLRPRRLGATEHPAGR